MARQNQVVVLLEYCFQAEEVAEEEVESRENPHPVLSHRYHLPGHRQDYHCLL